MDATPRLPPATPCTESRRGGQGCGQPVITVQSTARTAARRGEEGAKTGIGKVHLDGRGESDGNIWLIEGDDGQWRAQRHPPTKDDVPTVRCREHRCRTGSDPLVGPCAGGCGGTIRRYDPASTGPSVRGRVHGEGLESTLCRWCQDILDKWRSDPHRPASIPYGRWTDGIYQAGCPKTTKHLG